MPKPAKFKCPHCHKENIPIIKDSKIGSSGMISSRFYCSKCYKLIKEEVFKDESIARND